MQELRTLGRSGLLVSPIALGTMTMANTGWGSDAEQSAAVLDRYLEAGGNVLDTADVYAGGAGEELVGRLLDQRGLRDAVVLATKYGFAGGGGPVTAGSGRVNLVRALEGSLRRLGTDRIDLYWMHTWDGVTPAEEVVAGMAAATAAGKVVHYGFSNCPAWWLARAATHALAHGLPAPVALQVEYSLVSRDVEREHVPAAHDLGIGVMPWSPLAGGFLTGKYAQDDPASWAGRLSGENPFGSSKFTDRNWRVLDVLRSVADGLGHPPAEVATAWLLGRPGVDTVLAGARTPDQLETSLRAVELHLPDDVRQQLDNASAPDEAYPYAIFSDDARASIVGGGRQVRQR